MENRCIPLEMVKEIESNYPGTFNRLNYMVNDINISWNKKCYLPIGFATSYAEIVMNVMKPDINNIATLGKSMMMGQKLAALAPWRLYKQIYEFDEEMEQLLLQQGKEDMVVPTDVLDNIPYPCIYIKTKTMTGWDGFFIHFESEPDDDSLELRLTIVTEKSAELVPEWLHILPGKTIKECMEKGLDVVKQNLNNNPLMESIKEPIKEHMEDIGNDKTDIVTSLLQLVLYICAQNSEIEENEQQKKIYRKPRNKSSIKDKYSEVQIWNCGENTGNIIRRIKKEPHRYYYETHKTQSGGTPKRPHARRGHWHHYWTGKKEGGDRKLELKWVAPVFIHSQHNNDDIVTTNVIER